MAGSGKAHLRGTAALLAAEDLAISYRSGARRVRAVAGVSLDLMAGETLGVVGESGCGKSSTGRALLQLPPPESGTVVFDGVELTSLKRSEMRVRRKDIQMVFQDPAGSLNPRRSILDSVVEPLRVWGEEPDPASLARTTFREVGLDPHSVGRKLPSELSGGQCQRASIARALVLGPRVLVCDEPVSALDVSVQAQILNLLEKLKASRDLAMVFISHDLSVVSLISDRVLVMFMGKVCEVAPTADLFGGAVHPYTRLLLGSMPGPVRVANGGLPITKATHGAEPDVSLAAQGCRFRSRCPMAQELCRTEEPQMREVGRDHYTACHFAG